MSSSEKHSWDFRSVFQLPSAMGNADSGSTSSWSFLVGEVKKQAQTFADQAHQLAESAPAVATQISSVVASSTARVRDFVLEEEEDDGEDELTEVEKTLEEGLERGTQILSQVGMELTSWVRKAVTISPAVDESQKSRSIIYDRKHTIISQLRADPTTFLTSPISGVPGTIASPSRLGVSELSSSAQSEDPSFLEERFSTFSENFNVSAYAGEITRLLNVDSDLRRMMDRLVPSEVSYDTFWLRYYFRVAEIDFQEARRKKLVETVIRAKMEEDSGFDWDADDDKEIVDESDSQSGAHAKATASNKLSGEEDSAAVHLVSDGFVPSLSQDLSNHTPQAGVMIDPIASQLVAQDRDDPEVLPPPSESPISSVGDDKIAPRLSGDTVTTGVMVEPSLTASEELEGEWRGNESWTGTEASASARLPSSSAKASGNDDDDAWTGWD
ncbi:hypothetical protein HDU93_009834 [Gonapodya sp. JEL0774]|nr:hypothetical protein HDU93_009834 [Gonapodya sp. JEL0774]